MSGSVSRWARKRAASSLPAVPERVRHRVAQTQARGESAEARMTPIVAVGAFVFDSERVLVVERAKPPGEGLWTVPGGRLERGETLAQAVAREVREETGLVV